MHAYARKVAWVERTPSDMLQPNAWFMCQLSFTQLNEFSTSYTRTRAQLLRIPVALSSFFHRSFIFVLSSLTSVFQLPISPLCQDSRQFLSLSSSSSSSSFFFLPFWSLFNSFTFHGITCLLSCSIIRSICSFILFYLLFSYLLFSICPHWLSSICPSLLFPLSLSLYLCLCLFSSVSPLFVRRLLFNPLLVLLSVSLALNVWPCPSICLSVSLTLQLTELALSLSSAYSPSYSVQRKWYGAVPRSTRIAYVCNTLVTTEHKHRDSVYSVNELHTKKKKKLCKRRCVRRNIGIFCCRWYLL